MSESRAHAKIGVGSFFFMTEEPKDIDPKILEEIIEAVKRIKYGEVVITVYDSKVVQIEEKRKKRFN